MAIRTIIVLFVGNCNYFFHCAGLGGKLQGVLVYEVLTGRGRGMRGGGGRLII